MRAWVIGVVGVAEVVVWGAGPVSWVVCVVRGSGMADTVTVFGRRLAMGRLLSPARLNASPARSN
ncbi:hypothetical protein TPA0910_43230 [Streptomyces hygroscopicus subsp. sporocinereus]|uniref:Secreted protein n=1 Tax=Streptomyces hygroscopicus TaxID=1912 RepID=A0ABQ3U2P8_STRHY|nr:hypothetical protein [Streptomyces hygroscopicus]GHJ29890.1 hypothetical protein TPA0910_43230 [Streptomyces hygroscopicus]